MDSSEVKPAVTAGPPPRLGYAHRAMEAELLGQRAWWMPVRWFAGGIALGFVGSVVSCIVRNGFGAGVSWIWLALMSYAYTIAYSMTMPKESVTPSLVANLLGATMLVLFCGCLGMGCLAVLMNSSVEARLWSLVYLIPAGLFAWQAMTPFERRAIPEFPL